jgi:hypothetical protein
MLPFAAWSAERSPVEVTALLSFALEGVTTGVLADAGSVDVGDSSCRSSASAPVGVCTLSDTSLSAGTVGSVRSTTISPEASLS